MLIQIHRKTAVKQGERRRGWGGGGGGRQCYYYRGLTTTMHVCLLSVSSTALEPRLYTRWDAHKYARRAYELGVRYIGGCCGFEPYHIRAVAEELAPERADLVPPASDKHAPWGAGLRMHTKPWVRAR